MLAGAGALLCCKERRQKRARVRGACARCSGGRHSSTCLLPRSLDGQECPAPRAAPLPRSTLPGQQAARSPCTPVQRTTTAARPAHSACPAHSARSARHAQRAQRTSSSGSLPSLLPVLTSYTVLQGEPKTALLTGGRCRLQRPWGSSSLPPYQKGDDRGMIGIHARSFGDDACWRSARAAQRGGGATRCQPAHAAEPPILTDSGANEPPATGGAQARGAPEKQRSAAAREACGSRKAPRPPAREIRSARSMQSVRARPHRSAASITPPVVPKMAAAPLPTSMNVS